MRLAIVGDVHGHREELETILARVEEAQVDRIVLLGDLVDRGPDPLGCIQVARTWTFKARSGQTKNLDVIQGNHEDAYVRGWRGLPKPGQSHVSKPESRWLADRLDEETLRWMESLPYVIEEPRLGVVCLHGGVSPDMLTRDDLDARVARVRFLDRDGRTLPGLNLFPVPGDRHWSETYDGRFGFVVYGHQSWREPHRSPHALGLDGEGFDKIFAAVLTNENKDQVLRVSKTFETAHKIEPKPLFQPVQTHRRDRTRPLFAGMGW